MYNHYRKIEDVKSELSSWGSNPQVRFDAALGEQLFWPHSSGILASWLSGWVVGRLQRYLVVTFLVSGSLQTTPCAPYPSKQQRPTGWITATSAHFKKILSPSVLKLKKYWNCKLLNKNKFRIGLLPLVIRFQLGTAGYEEQILPMWCSSIKIIQICLILCYWEPWEYEYSLNKFMCPLWPKS